MKLQQLLQDLTEHPVMQDLTVNGLTQNSKTLQRGEVFVALVGAHVDGRNYINDAISKGAIAILAEAQGKEAFSFPTTTKSPIIYINNLDEKLDDIASRFYGHPSQQFEQIIGVTGTNGKTTTCYLLAQALSKLAKPCGFIGTIGSGFVPNLAAGAYTTPEPIVLQKTMQMLLAQGAKALCMEVSSHGLMQSRVKSVNFTSAHFTNLTQDHLDYHGTMQAYGKAKQKLFEFQSLAHVVVNKDDPFSDKMIQALHKEIPVAAYTLQTKITSPSRIKPSLFFPLTLSKLALDQKGINAMVDSPWGQGKLHSPLLGQFNVSNLLAVLAELCLQGFDFKVALDALAHAQPAPGRMQKIGSVRTPQVIVDYAHTPDALENALKAARLHCQRRLWCVFGCGGDRDKDKRSKMGDIAATLADRIIITNDNPRTENPSKIIEEILQGVKAQYGEKVIVKEDRQEAIAYAIDHALAVDIILVAGKGHENVQIIQDKVYPFSDAQVVNTLLSEEKSEAFRNR
ncbi:MAG: UDP-N-acetylmuramoyl-L-alanyl-D-glutamate--2,6-diaminopimelate ligase [Proteobacteria bacterium]|nr:UDP-N-acetylmuramoyl-L-alanyl-D-glutamate--2,6-diaminopimelate ligase [Pseudomonadota bacterium]